MGDAAALEPAHYCYHCEQCLRGRHNICQRLRFLSTPGHPGFFRDRVNLPVENLLPLPPSLSVPEGTLVEPMAVVLHSLSLAPPALGDTAVVLGGGPIGLLTTAALLRARREAGLGGRAGARAGGTLAQADGRRRGAGSGAATISSPR